MPNTFLHVGHGKTGTSFIQTCLAQNQEILLKNGILYPDHPSIGMASDGKITKGNVKVKRDWINEISKERDQNKDLDILYSSEVLYKELQSEVKFERLLNECRDVIIILFIRNPLEYLLSSYNQLVKRHGYTSSLNHFAEHDTSYSILYNFLEYMRRNSVDFVVRNYSYHKSEIVSTFMTALGRDDIFPQLNFDKNKRINRSLCASEVALQIQFNKYFGNLGGEWLGDPLCNELPNLDLEPAKLSEQSYERWLQNQANYFDLINEIVPDTESLQLQDIEPSSQSDYFQFTQDQLEILARVSARRYLKINKELKSIKPATENDIDCLVKAAASLQGKDIMSDDEILKLFKLAKKFRPDGSFINMKIQEFEKKLFNSVD